MKDKKYYLKEEVYFEPLFNQWYAWTYLIPPVTAVRHLFKNHYRIMKSFINNSQLHIMASKDASLAGAEFLNCTENQISDVKKLVEDIDSDLEPLKLLSEAVTKLDSILADHTSGESISYIYEKIPTELKGYVEIYLDMEHRPSYRFIEPLLYKSQYYDTSLQSLSFGLLTAEQKERPFVFSTPRLADKDHIQISVEFNSEKVDKLFKSREFPISGQDIEEIFNQNNMRGGLDHWDLFTETRPKIANSGVKKGIRVQYTGHAGFLIETKSITILVDPVIANRRSNESQKILSYSDLPSHIDYICLTHNHQDHANLETLIQLRYKTDKVIVSKNNGGTIVDPSLKLILNQLGFDVIEVDDLDEINFPDGKIIAIPFLGEHGDLNIRTKSAWVIEALGRKFFFGADSANPDINLYKHLEGYLNDVDLYCIGMECVGAPYTWIYGALHSKVVSKAIKNSRRLNGSDFQQAYPLVEMLQPKQVFIYALGLEPWFKYFMGIDYDENSAQIVESKKMLEACSKISIPAESLYGRKKILFD
ncbi:MBL fold metallo-hydrolase [Microbulbifer epialgicus]|uniref:MBL fold metallo-hydrolase n=1 Tax=Microbulbifer epialgicus TaxID=393907 RepID=A0ABV4P3D5_9GAMM